MGTGLQGDATDVAAHYRCAGWVAYRVMLQAGLMLQGDATGVLGWFERNSTLERLRSLRERARGASRSCLQLQASYVGAASLPVAVVQGPSAARRCVGALARA